MLQADRSACSMRLPLESYSTNEGAGAGAWVLLEIRATGDQEVRTGGDPQRFNTELSA